MSNIRYKMELSVPANLVGPVFELLAGDGLVTLIEPENQHKRKPNRRYVTTTVSSNVPANSMPMRFQKEGTRGPRPHFKHGGMTSKQLILESLHKATEHQLTRNQLIEICVKNGYQEITFVSESNRLLREGKIFASPTKNNFWVKP